MAARSCEAWAALALMVRRDMSGNAPGRGGLAPSGARALRRGVHGDVGVYSPRSTLTTRVVACEEGLSPMCPNILGNPAVGLVSPGGTGLELGERTWP